MNSKRSWWSKRRVWSMVLIALSMLFAMAAAGNFGLNDNGFDGTMKNVAAVGAWVMIAVSVLLWWRMSRPVLVTAIIAGATLMIPTYPLAVLIALAAATAQTRGKTRWILIGVVYITVGVAYTWDISVGTSQLAAFVDRAPLGSEAREQVKSTIPLLAALSVAPFAAFGFARAYRRERDEAVAGTKAAVHNVVVLQDEVDRQRERTELARELHDTLAAKLSAVSLHAGALELAAEDERSAEAARTARQAAQGSLDDLRNIVNVLRNPHAAYEGRGLSDLFTLIDELTAGDVSVRAQVMVNDSAAFHPAIAHAAYRVVQESVSNVRRHAPGSAIRVDVRGNAESGLTIRVENQLTPGAAPTSVGGGNGIVGMRERVSELGGSFQAEPAEGTFSVLAWLPVAPPVA